MRPSHLSAFAGLALVLLSLDTVIKAQASTTKTGTTTVNSTGAVLTRASAGSVTLVDSYSSNVTLSSSLVISGINWNTGGTNLIFSNTGTTTSVTETSTNVVFVSSGGHLTPYQSNLANTGNAQLVLNASNSVTLTAAQLTTTSAPLTVINITTQVPTVQISGGSKLTSTQPLPFNFPTTLLGKSTKKGWVNIKYNGTGSLVVQMTAPTGTNAADYSVSPSAAVTLKTGQQVALEVTFAPTSTGTRQAATVLTMTEDDKAPSVLELALSGYGLVASSNANLHTLRLYADGFNLGRDLNTFVHPNISGSLSATVDYTRLYAIPVVQDSKARVTVNGVATASGAYSAPMPMKIGDNPVTVVVTAEDGVTAQTYTVSVTRGRFKTIAQRFSKLVPSGITDGATIGQFYDVSINNLEGVAFTGQLVGGTGGVAEDSAAWSTWQFSGSPALMLRAGESVGGGQTVGRDLLFPRIANGGGKSLFSNVVGQGPIRSAQWVDSGGGDVYMAGSQTTVFEAPPSFHAFTGFSYSTQQHWTGVTCFAANLVEGGRGTTRVNHLNDSGLWTVSQWGDVTAGAREGEALPATVGRGLVQGEVMRAAAGAYDYAAYSGQVRGTGVTSDNAQVILARDIIKKTPPLLIARTGAQAAGLPKGVKYYNLLGEGGHTPEVTFWAQLTGPGVTAENNRALFQSDYPGTGLPTQLLLRDDDDLSAVFGAGVKFRGVLAFWTLANGAVVVQGQLKGPSITAANDVFVARLTGAPSSMIVIAREGSVLAGAGNSTLDTIQQVDVGLWGEFAVLCSLVNGTGDTAGNLNNQVLMSATLFSSYFPTTLQTLIRKGTPLAGGTSPVYSIQITKNIVQGNTGSTTGMSRAINDQGKVAVIVTTMDNNQGVFVGP